MSELIKTFRSKIYSLQETLKNIPKKHHVDLPVKHHFSKDIYGRELFIPKGTVLVGKIHKHSSLNILAKGKMTLLTEDGLKTIEAPYTVVSKPGIKRAAYIHEDCTWVTVHGTDETDLEKIEDKFIAQDYSEVEGIGELYKLQEKEG